MRKGQISRPAVKWANAMAGFYNKPSDPSWLRRHDGGESGQSPLKGLPVNPPFARMKVYTFDTAYDVDTTNVWTQDAAGSGTGLTVLDARGGQAQFINGATNNDFYSYQRKYEQWNLVDNKTEWFWTTITIADVSEADLFVGVCALLGSGNLFDNRLDAIGFYTTDSDPTLFCECNKDGTPTQATAGVDLSDGIEKWLGFRAVNKTQVEFWVGDANNAPRFVKKINTNLPDDELMAVSFGLRNGTGSANNMTISDIFLPQDI